MNIIGRNAQMLWTLLQNKENAEVGKLMKESKLSDIEFWAAIGWLSCEGKLDCSTETRDGRTTIVFSLLA